MALNAYTNCSPIVLGCFLYQDSGLTTPVANGFYSDGTNVFEVTGGAGEITNVTSCPVTTTTTTSTTTAAPITTTTTTTTTEAPTTTTTTSTTTEAPTTTTTTTTTTSASITCTQWINLSGISAYYDWNDCDGTIHLNEEILNNGIICAQDGTVSFISGGTLTQQSACGVFPSTTTTTTTSTTTLSGSTTTTTTITPASIQINNSSVDIGITGMNINSVPVSYSSGTNFTISTGDPQGNFTSSQIGTYNVEIFYSASVSGQSINFVDSNLTITCQNVSGSGSFVINNAVIDNVTTISVTAGNGSCS